LAVQTRDVWIDIDLAGEEVGWGVMPFLRIEETFRREFYRYRNRRRQRFNRVQHGAEIVIAGREDTQYQTPVPMDYYRSLARSGTDNTTIPASQRKA
jgi:hypothetical protein